MRFKPDSRFAAAVLALLFSTTGSGLCEEAEKVPIDGKKLFESHCASCHRGGGNIVNPKRPVKGSNVLATYATFRAYLNEPIGDMPHYEHLLKDDEMLRPLYKYVKELGVQSPAVDPAKDGSADKKKKDSKKKSKTQKSKTKKSSSGSKIEKKN